MGKWLAPSLIVLGLSVSILSVLVHPFAITPADLESYGTTLSLCASGVGKSGGLLSEEFSAECSQIGTMKTIALSARAGWFLGAAILLAGAFILFRKGDSGKKKR